MTEPRAISSQLCIKYRHTKGERDRATQDLFPHPKTPNTNHPGDDPAESASWRHSKRDAHSAPSQPAPASLFGDFNVPARLSV